MFDKQYRFTGAHAQMVNDLTATFDEESKVAVFERNLDVYINAPLIGFLYCRKGTKNTTGDITPQNIFAEQMRDNDDILQYILRLIMVLDVQYEPDLDKRMDKAFRFLGNDESDLALFDAYVLGGVEVLHEKLIAGVADASSFIGNLYDFIEDFQDKFNSSISSDDVLGLCQAAIEQKN